MCLSFIPASFCPKCVCKGGCISVSCLFVCLFVCLLLMVEGLVIGLGFLYWLPVFKWGLDVENLRTS